MKVKYPKRPAVMLGLLECNHSYDGDAQVGEDVPCRECEVEAEKQRQREEFWQRYPPKSFGPFINVWRRGCPDSPEIGWCFEADLSDDDGCLLGLTVTDAKTLLDDITQAIAYMEEHP